MGAVQGCLRFLSWRGSGGGRRSGSLNLDLVHGAGGGVTGLDRRILNTCHLDVFMFVSLLLVLGHLLLEAGSDVHGLGLDAS